MKETDSLVDRTQSILELVTETLSARKAIDVVAIDLTQKSSLADFMVIASGTSSRHVISLIDLLVKELKPRLKHPMSVEGLQKGDWVVLDAGDVIVHIFKEEVRAFYNLEKMWGSNFEVDVAEKLVVA